MWEELEWEEVYETDQGNSRRSRRSRNSCRSSKSDAADLGPSLPITQGARKLERAKVEYRTALAT